MNRSAGAGVLLGVAALVTSCGVHRLERTLVTPAGASTLDRKSPFLKVHLKNGQLYVLGSWSVDSAQRVVAGNGDLLDWNRLVVASGTYRLPLDSVALFETNVVSQSRSATALTVMAGITAAAAGFCIASPKTCFGSCPTFYVPGPNGPLLQAEGFSASIAPGLEATDLDALYRAAPKGRDFVVRMTNEAFETHVVRSVNLVTVRRPTNGRVFVTKSGAFWQANGVTEPTACQSSDGDCRELVRRFDGIERVSAADSSDLGAKETVHLTFAPATGQRIGLVITARQTLLTTYVLYQGLSYLGSGAGQFLASLSNRRDSTLAQSGLLGKVLGGIEVLVPDSAGGWTPVGDVGETGPLAADTKLVPIPGRGPGPLRIRLRMTRGLWRLDYVALASLAQELTPTRLTPARVVRGGQEDRDALAALLDSTRVLTTLPGDEYELHFRLPPDPSGQELFLEARGYYLEWMRQEWLAEENPRLAANMLLDPAGMLRALAPAYKRQEAIMEKVFWNSRYVRH